jgi:hypothetical protein
MWPKAGSVESRFSETLQLFLQIRVLACQQLHRTNGQNTIRASRRGQTPGLIGHTRVARALGVLHGARTDWVEVGIFLFVVRPIPHAQARSADLGLDSPANSQIAALVIFPRGSAMLAGPAFQGSRELRHSRLRVELDGRPSFASLS